MLPLGSFAGEKREAPHRRAFADGLAERGIGQSGGREKKKCSLTVGGGGVQSEGKWGGRAG